MINTIILALGIACLVVIFAVLCLSAIMPLFNDKRREGK